MSSDIESGFLGVQIKISKKLLTCGAAVDILLMGIVD